MGKLELVTKFKMEQENEHLQAYKRVFPHARPTIFQMELIEQTVTDAEAWRTTLIFWGGNNYRADSIFKMLEYYKEALGKKKFVNREPEKAINCIECLDSGHVNRKAENATYDWQIEIVDCPRCKVAA
jgi:hypothetical protein